MRPLQLLTGTVIALLSLTFCGRSRAQGCSSTGDYHLFYVGTFDYVDEICWDTLYGWQYFSSGVGAPDTALASFYAGGVEHIGYTEHNRQLGITHIYQLYGGEGNWVSQDLSAASKAPNAMYPTPLTGYTAFAANIQAFAYLTYASHVEQVLWNGSYWIAYDLTAAVSGAPVAASNSSLTSYLATNVQSIIFETSAGHIGQLYNSGSGWVFSDLTNVTGALPAESGSPLTSMIDLANAQDVYYVDSKQLLHLLRYVGSWIDAGEPSSNVVLSSSRLDSYQLYDADAVFYQATNGDVYDAWDNDTVLFGLGDAGTGLAGWTYTDAKTPTVVFQHDDDIWWRVGGAGGTTYQLTGSGGIAGAASPISGTKFSAFVNACIGSSSTCNSDGNPNASIRPTAPPLVEGTPTRAVQSRSGSHP